MYYQQSDYAHENSLRGYDFRLSGKITEASAFWQPEQTWLDDRPVFRFVLGSIYEGLENLEILEERALDQLESPNHWDLKPVSKIWKEGRYGSNTDEIYF